MEHVFRGGGPADDVAGQRLRYVVALERGDGAEGSHHLSGLGSERGREFERPGAVGGRLPGGYLRDGGGVHVRVLADVQRLQVQAVGTDLQQQGVDQHAGKAAATVAHQAGAQHVEVAEEFGGAGVGPQRRIRGQLDGHVGSAAEAHHDAAHQQAGGLEGDAVFKGGVAGGAKLRQVAFQQQCQFRRDGDEPGRGRELIEDVLQPVAIVRQQQAPRHGQRFAGGFRRDEWVAVAVSADPGAEADQLGHLGEDRFHPIFRGQGRGDLRVEDGQRVEDGRLVVVERHANLVAHGGTQVAHVVGLPQRGDLSDDLLLQGIEAGFGDGDAVELHQQVGDAALFEHDRAASNLSGVRGEYRRDADAFEQRASLVRGDPGKLHLPERAA